ncbi:MAG: peptidoglycan DD-metalloendopeptidase family protein [Magnetococcales bacterium]|nr:peptidoglycan DD-metalloendopeptidase family protein [Magnetococcales bacterium]
MTIHQKYSFQPLAAVLVVLAGFVAVGCTSKPPKPTVRIASGPPLAWGENPAERINKSAGNIYLVQPGDTLWAIAAVHGVELEDLASWNKIDNTELLWVGQGLYLSPPKINKSAAVEKTVVVVKPAMSQQPVSHPTITQPKQTETNTVENGTLPEIKPKVRPVSKSEAQAVAKKSATKGPMKRTKSHTETSNNHSSRWKLPLEKPDRWDWPHNGKLINRFGSKGQHRNNGIDIAVRVGDPVRAAADGIVAYADSGLPGYGNMILLRHGGSYMTAYGYVNQILVRRGQPIKAGQRIALAGQSGHAPTPRLHFEIRYQVKPLDPLRHLPSRN